MRSGGLVIDYVYAMPLGASDGTGNLHNISLSFKFGRSYSENDLEDELLRERAAVLRAQEALMEAEAQAAYIKKERNTLLTEYGTELERLKSELEEAKSQATLSPIVVVPDHPLTSPAERERAARQQRPSGILRDSAYDAAMRAYATRGVPRRGPRGAGRIRLKVDLGQIRQPKALTCPYGRSKELERVQLGIGSSRPRTIASPWTSTKRPWPARSGHRVERLSLVGTHHQKIFSPPGSTSPTSRKEIAKLKKPGSWKGTPVRIRSKVLLYASSLFAAGLRRRHGVVFHRNIRREEAAFLHSAPGHEDSRGGDGHRIFSGASGSIA
jgi:hypothetical protein